jgi:naphtho-gamma-pyrone polyketide synthase
VLNTVLPPAGGPKTVPKGSAPATKVGISKKEPVRKAPKPAVKTSAPGVLVQALRILASEVGLSESELSDDLVFADYGVDSLLSLTITGKFREELDIDLESSVFMDYPSVKNLKQYLMQLTSPADSSESSMESSIFEDSTSSTDPSTPGTPGYFATPETKIVQVTEDNTTIATIRQTLIEEIGVSPEELTGDSNIG